MGACMAVANAGKPLLDEGFKDGTEKDYYSRFIEDKVLGTGSFGQVKQVFEVEQSRSDTPYACKILHKGWVWFFVGTEIINSLVNTFQSFFLVFISAFSSRIIHYIHP